MTLLDIHKWINFVLDKEQAGYFSPEEIDAALDQGQIFLFNYHRARYGVDQESQDALSVFKNDYAFTNANTPGGLLSFPQNYQSFLGAYVQKFEDGVLRYKGIEIVNDDELAERLMSSLRPISVNDPIGQWRGQGQIQLWPKVPNAGFAQYLRRPEVPRMSYELDGRTIVYNDISSTQLEWDDPNTQKIMIKALEYLGVNLENDRLIAYAKS